MQLQPIITGLIALGSIEWYGIHTDLRSAIPILIQEAHIELAKPTYPKGNYLMVFNRNLSH